MLLKTLRSGSPKRPKSEGSAPGIASAVSVSLSASITATVILVFAVPAIAQTASTADSGAVSFELTAERIRLYTGMATAAGQAANRGADVALDRLFGRPEGEGKGAVAQRIIRGYLVNLPLAFASHYAAHELGHLTRLQESGGSVVGTRVGGTLWPFPHLTNRWGRRTGSLPNEAQELAITSGGFDAAFVQERSLVDQIYSGSRANYFDWFLLMHAKLDLPVYTWTSRLSELGEPFVVVRDLDPREYAEEFGVLRAHAGGEEIPVHVHTGMVADRISGRVWLNVLDYALFAAVLRTSGYMRTGERESSNPVLMVRGMSLVPRARFALTSAGLETGAEVLVVGSQYLTRVSVRSTETASGEHLRGFGLEVRPRLRPGWAPQVRGDVFQRRQGPLDSRTGLPTGGRALGARFEIGAQGPLRVAHETLDVSIRAGYKTQGYFPDAPDRRTLLAGMSARIRF